MKTFLLDLVQVPVRHDLYEETCNGAYCYPSKNGLQRRVWS